GLDGLLQHPGPPEGLFITIGAWVLTASIASMMRSLSTVFKLIAMAPNDAASKNAACEDTRHVTNPVGGLFADGVSVKRAGDLTYRLCRDALDEIITVDTDAICAAIKDVYENCRAIAEPAGARALAGLKAYAARGPGGTEGGGAGALMAI